MITYFTIYKITNIINNKIYIGAHKTTNLDDNYMGSGKLIKRSINKYGLQYFKKEYIEIFNNEEDMFKMESKIVNQNYLNGDNIYNISVGGKGGWTIINNNKTIEERKKNGSWENYEKRIQILETIPIEKRKQIGKQMGDKYGGRNKLSNDEIDNRFKLIEDIDLTKFGWVKKVSDKLEISHTQVKRFVDKYYNGEIYRRI